MATIALMVGGAITNALAFSDEQCWRMQTTQLGNWSVPTKGKKSIFVLPLPKHEL